MSNSRSMKLGNGQSREMAYHALDSLENTIKRLVNSSRISILYPTEEILKSAHDGVESIREFLQEYDWLKKSIESERRKALEGQIREAVRELENAIESHVLDQLLSQSEETLAGQIREAVRELEDAIGCHVLDQLLSQSDKSLLAGDVEQHRLLFSLDLQELRQDVDCFIEKATKMKKLYDLVFEEEDGVLSLISDLAGDESEMVGLSEQYRKIRDRLINVYATRAASIFGMKDDKYIEELESQLPAQVDDDAVSSKTDSIGRDPEMDGIPHQYHKIARGLLNWFLIKAASIFGVEEDINELHNPLIPEEEDDDGAASLTTAFDGNKSADMVGLSDQFHQIRDRLLGRHTFGELPIIGMAGIGKTTLAKKIFEDPLIVGNFDCRAFVRVGQKYQSKKILQAILAQVNPDSDNNFMKGDEKELREYLRDSLNGRKYLIVLDDVWNSDIWYDLTNMHQIDGGSWILVTSRLRQAAAYVKTHNTYYMRFLNKEESWDLLRGIVFAKDVCPLRLEKVGKKIAENCEGLPLLIVTVAHLLSISDEKTPEYWNKVAADKENSIFTDAYEQILKVLYPSYNHLPQYLKTSFLYMAVFPQNYEVSFSRLVNLWSADGSFDDAYKDVQSTVEDCFHKLVSSNLVLVRQQSRLSNKPKFCTLHSVFWHLCKKEAQNNKFLHVFNSYSDAFTEGIESMRCLSIYKNILFGIKDVYDSIASISTTRLLLCTGPHHRYQVPICFSLRLLRVLDAVTIRFYKFPIEILKLIYLTYLTLTCNENIPSSISKLWKLRCLIVHQHLRVKSTAPESYLPVEIWYLQELNYLQVIGRNLPDSPRGAVLHNLLTLLDVGAESCTKSVLQSIPNLNKLRVQIELAPDVAEPLSCFDHISVLNKLKSLQCVVMNPDPRSTIVAPPSLHSVFTSSLTKLTLSGFGYPWRDTHKIADLPSLEVLKLQCYAFQGERWQAEEYRFPSLKYLLIEDTDLVQWTAGYKTFPKLFCLTIKHCYRLREIPKISSVREIRLVDCNPLSTTCAKQMEHDDCHVYADSSFFVG